jgi:protein-tyrosine-phosphatase
MGRSPPESRKLAMFYALRQIVTGLGGVMSDVAESMFRDFPDPERSVFLMIGFQDTELHRLVTNSIRSTLDRYGLGLIRADVGDFRETLWGNVRFCMDACGLGVAVFDAVGREAVSPNVALELGYMMAKGRRCLLLKDDRVTLLPADLAGHLCQEFSAAAIEETIPPSILRWLRDMGIHKQPDERVVVFVSTGGTCRDPMAKAITDSLLRRDHPRFKVRTEAAAFHPHGTGASRAARLAIKQILGEDVLAHHHPRILSPGLIEDADLILVMNDYMRKGLPSEKTWVLKDFFGSTGDIDDPWPDGEDEQTSMRYLRCGQEILALIEPNMPRLLEFLAAKSDI